MKDILNAGFAELGIEPDGQAEDRLEKYYDLLTERNAVMNLTAITGREDTARLHFLDCAALLKYAPFGASQVIDIGAGAGFPGLVLKILSPETDITLLDSQNKRVEFLRECCSELGLSGVECLCLRAEESPKEYRATFDVATSRAVARLNALCELCLPFVKVGGVMIAMKGPDCGDEVREAQSAIKLLGGEYVGTETYTIPGTDIRHAAVIIRKIKPTHPKYPRRWPQIKKNPL